MKQLLALVIMSVSATSVAAHPHVFVDTGFAFSFDAEGRLTEVEITWAYDEFYSLLITEDMALDADFDGILTAPEQAALTGFDMQWVAGFNGDLVIMQGDQTMALSGPKDYTATLRDGRVITTHVRSVSGVSRDNTPVQVKPYDRTYYTAYDVTLPVTVEGSSTCRSRVQMPDITKGLLAVQNELAALDADRDPQDEGLPDIGADLATTVVVTCAAS
tara:strand:- start:2585 stop:3235 length:651 start_codon:yes stop_codon:yes gene_type:complete